MKANEIQQHDIISHEGHQVYVGLEPAISENGMVGIGGVTAIDNQLVQCYSEINPDEQVTLINRFKTYVAPAAPADIEVTVGFEEKKEEVIS